LQNVPKYAAQPGESHVSRAIPGVVHIDHMTALCADEKVVFSKHDLKTVPFVAVWATTFFSPKPREQSLDLTLFVLTIKGGWGHGAQLCHP
jgi:hypothetical protein